MSTSIQSRTGLLVIAYLRPDNLELILERAKESGINRFYISIDNPRIQSRENLKLHAQVLDRASRFQLENEFEVKIHARKQNVGCSAAVLSSCDWFFDQIEYGIILEDDCIPSNDFFKYCLDSFPIIENARQIWLSCGTQFAESSLDTDWSTSKYALTWGWATTRNKWLEISRALKDGYSPIKESRSKSISVLEAIYWNAGARRAYAGISDAWDTPLVQQMMRNKRFSILPNQSLVTNIGNDAAATHTHGAAIGIGTKTGEYLTTNRKPSNNLEIDEWLSKRFYKVRFRHFFSTKARRLLDRIQFKNWNQNTLLQGWEKARIEI